MLLTVGVDPYKHEPRKKVKHSVFSRNHDCEKTDLYPSDCVGTRCDFADAICVFVGDVGPYEPEMGMAERTAFSLALITARKPICAHLIAWEHGVFLWTLYAYS